MRKAVFERDHGVCAKCGVDTEALLREVEAQPWEDFYKRAVRKQLMRSEVGVGNPPYWHADHIVPVAEGGGALGIKNLRTLCHQCHLEVTREMKKRNTKAEVKARKLNQLREMREQDADI